MPKSKAILYASGRLVPLGRVRNRYLDRWGLANVALGQADEGVGGVLFPAGQGPRIQRAHKAPAGVVAAGLALGCLTSIGVTWARKVVPKPKDSVEAFARDPLALREYSDARRILLGQETNGAGIVTLPPAALGCARRAPVAGLGG